MKKGNKSKKKTTPKKKKPSKKKTSLKNKRFIAISIAGFLFLVIALSFISVENMNITGHATDDLFKGINSVAERIVEMVTPFFSTILGGEMAGGYLFTKILFFIIVFGIILLSLKQIDFFKSNPVILNIIAIAVSLLAVRGLSIEMIETIILPSKALGVALLAGIPFAIYFIIINVGFKTQSSILRRIAWIFFGVVFIGLWLSSGEKLKDSNLQYIYLATAIGAIIMALIDGTIGKWFAKFDEQKLANMKARKRHAKAKEEIYDIERRVEKGVTSPSEGKEQIKDVKKTEKFFGGAGI